MKRETLRHPKTFDLAARLNRRRPEVLGFLTLLWDFAADVAPAGNLGKHSDGAIARACDWDGDPSEFVDALVAAGWLNRDSTHRLLIHDWPDHCERWVSAKLKKLGLVFAVASIERSTEPSTDATTDATTEPSCPRDRTNPNQTKPNQTNPNQNARERYTAAFEAWYAAYPRHVAKATAAASYGRSIDRIALASGRSKAEAQAWLLEITIAFAKTPKGMAGEKCPHPATWLNGGRYDDDPAEWQRVEGTGNGRIAASTKSRIGPGQRYRE